MPSHPTIYTTTSGGSAIPKQQLERNNNWNETQQIPKNWTVLYPNSISNFRLQPINLYLHSQLQLLPTRKHFCYFSPEGPAVTKYSKTEGRMKEIKEDKILLHDSVY